MNGNGTPGEVQARILIALLELPDGQHLVQGPVDDPEACEMMLAEAGLLVKRHRVGMREKRLVDPVSIFPAVPGKLQ